MALITVIMNCYNGEAYLRKAIDSVFAQTFQDWEILFVDDCSTDRSVDIARSYEASGRLRIVSTPSRITLYEARNVGLEHARGDYIAFLDVDDRWRPDALAALFSRMGPDVGFVYGGVQYIDERGSALPMRRIPSRSGHVLNALLLRSFIAVSCILVRAEIVRAEKFDPFYVLMGDYEMWVRILAAGYACECVPLALLENRIHGENISIRMPERWIVEQRRFYRSMLRHHGLRFPMILAFIVKYELGHLLWSSPATRLQGIATGGSRYLGWLK
jgi:glycosyltransferase involved in cell wall biosynthesis